MTGPVLVDGGTLPELRLFVPGQPAPQGSKTNYRTKNNKVNMVEDNPKTKPWREDIRQAYLTHAAGVRFDRDLPLVVHLRFVFRRLAAFPKHATTRGGKPTRPTPDHTTKPDLDKLARAVLDALTSAGAWFDDGQVTKFGTLEKRYAEIGETPGCWIHVQVKRGRTP